MNGMEEMRGFACGGGTRGSVRGIKGWRKTSNKVKKMKNGSVERKEWRR
jgi:hypothetical protein